MARSSKGEEDRAGSSNHPPGAKDSLLGISVSYRLDKITIHLPRSICFPTPDIDTRGIVERSYYRNECEKRED